jgi:Leucine-rich repeat (LRR) protein
VRAVPSVDCADTATTGVPQSEREALSTLYTSTNGSGWRTNTNWNITADVGTWHGVTIIDGHVSRVSLVDNLLNGSIPDLSALVQLQTLDLHYNEMKGSISDLSAFTHLQTLNLSTNQLSGNIPDLSRMVQILIFREKSERMRNSAAQAIFYFQSHPFWIIRHSIKNIF